ncbi:MAG: Hsp20/alpha crystallin family protein [Vicinamibacterales bacterium]
MFRMTRFTPYDELFTFQREIDRLFNQFWTDLPARTASAPSTAFQAATTDEGWRVDVPMPGIDPAHVSLEAAGNTLSIRAQEPASGKNPAKLLFEQTLTVPQFLDLEKVTASHRHGMLQLTIPLKESVKPRRIQIAVKDEQPQLVGA